MAIKIFLTLAVFYHVLATVAAMAGAFQLLRIALGKNAFNPFAKKAFLNGELHLWISGCLIVGIGLYLQGMQYLLNPKLWTKVSLIAAWGVNSLLIKACLKKAGANAKCVLFGISSGSLLYGTFLGVAKPLANGTAPFAALLAGYGITLALGIVSMRMLFRQQTFPLPNPRPVAIS